MTRRQIYLSTAGVLVVAIALGAVGFRFSGHRTEGSAAPSRQTSGNDRPFADGAERPAFVTNAVSSCAKEMAATEPLGRHLSAGEIEIYCQCYSNAMADAVTADDVRQMAAGGEPMTIVHDKAARVLQSCGALLPSK